MAKQTIATLKNWFKKGLKPTEQQFADWLDSFFHKDATNIQISSVENLQTTLNGLAPTTAITALVDDVPSAGNTLNKLYSLIQDIEDGGIGGSSGFAIAETYTNIAGLLSNQGEQEDDAWYMVQTATTDPTVGSGWAIYQYLGTTAGTLADYMKIIEQEGLDLVVNDATSVLKGVMKLYTNLSASNADGSVTQAAIVTALAAKADKLARTPVVTTGSTMTLDFANKDEAVFLGATSFTGSKTIALSNIANAVVMSFLFQVSGSGAELTLGSSFRSSDSRLVAGIFTITGAGFYEFSAIYDGSFWRLKAEIDGGVV